MGSETPQLGDLPTWAGASTADDRGAAPTVAALEPGAVIGRYVVLARLGQGAMGVVYEAHDPQLGRKVAVKILHQATDSDDGRARLLREAQALARLTHPNVVAIHDAGTLGERVWLAMEFVAGTTLGAWLRARRRPWPDVLRVLLLAGRGLSAAHDKGLVHRDFKPENVMLTPGGRALVMDFGLAKPDDGAAAPHPPAALPVATSASVDALAADLTRAGGVVGTPAYMAPEQFLALTVDARADQFSFCVTLWEALYGVRPFAGETPTAIVLQAIRGRLRTPRGARVPAWLRRIVARGLAPEAAQRHPSMRALLAELTAGQARARRRRLLAALAALAALALAALAALRVDHVRRARACDDLAGELRWHDGRRAAVRAALLATRTSYAATTAERVLPGLDAWADRWRAVRQDTCRAADVDRTWPADLRARADECLADHRDRFDALVDALARADATVAQQAVSAVARLAAPDRCGAARDLSLRPALPDGDRGGAVDVRQQLARAATLDLTAQYADGLQLAQAALARAERLAWPPLIAEASARVAGLRARTGAYAEAEAAMTRAYVTAGTTGAGESAADAAIGMVAIAHRRGRRGEALAWSQAAAVALAQIGGGGDDDLRGAQLAAQLASVHSAAGNFAEARDLDHRALEIRARMLGPDHPDTAAVVNNLANVEQALGNLDAARDLLERALAADLRAYGPDHPEVALTLGNLALVRHELGDFVGARDLQTRARTVAEQALGPDHPTVATIVFNLGSTLMAMDDLDGARALFERALAIEERTFGPDHPAVAGSLTNLASLHGLRGDYAAAEALQRRALAIWRRDGGDSPDVAVALVGLAESRLAQGDHAEAGRLYAEARALLERTVGPDHEHVAHSLLGLADVALAESRPADAVPLAERARTIGDATPHSDLGVRARFTLAEALWALGEHGRAVELAAEVRDRLRVDGDEPQRLAHVEAWLAEHVPGR